MYHQSRIVHSLLLLLLLVNHWANGHMYGLMLQNPIPDDLVGLGQRHKAGSSEDSGTYRVSDAMSTEEASAHQAHQPSIASALTSHDVSPSLAISSIIDSSATHASSGQSLSSSSSLSFRIHCKQDSDCIDDEAGDDDYLMYCDRHYGYCDFFRQVGELCRTDSQCDQGLICMFGRCDRPAPPGERGSRCSGQASDCNDGLCCARQHGERICKPKLQLGQQCFVPLGGLDYSLNELCPCEESLHCAQASAVRTGKKQK